MPRFLALSGIAVILIAACSSSPAASIAPTRPSATTAGQPGPAGTGPALVPGAFDIDRVRLMEPSDLPEDVPVPVPFGGEIDELHELSEGRSLLVNYDARFFATAAAFYAAWFEQEGLEASPLLSFADPYAGWEVIVDGEPVRVQVGMSSDESQTQLTITWD
jgi:hypothetical protein